MSDFGFGLGFDDAWIAKCLFTRRARRETTRAQRRRQGLQTLQAERAMLDGVAAELRGMPSRITAGQPSYGAVWNRPPRVMLWAQRRVPNWPIWIV